jgi:hypothetical protein
MGATRGLDHLHAGTVIACSAVLDDRSEGLLARNGAACPAARQCASGRSSSVDWCLQVPWAWPSTHAYTRTAQQVEMAARLQSYNAASGRLHINCSWYMES